MLDLFLFFLVEINKIKVMASTVVKKERKKWSEDEMEMLIDLYEARPCLWDIFCIEYSKRDAKEKALSEISDQLDVSVEEIKSKWLGLRAQFGRELRSVTKTKSGQSTEELYVSQWVFVDKLQFLQPMMKTKKKS